MSLRQQNLGSFIKPGFNPLAAPTPTYLYNLYSWGANTYGQLGLGNTTSYSSPKQVGSSTVWVNASSSSTVAAAIKTDGTLWTWGYGGYGTLGLSTTINYSSPKQVGALTNWLRVSCGYLCMVAVKTDGTLWTWGNGGYGTLGLGNTSSYSSPKQVGSLTNWTYAYAGVFAMGAIKTDGTLWTWGNDQGSGLLGQGNTSQYNSPKQVGALTNWLSIHFGQYAATAIKTDGTLWTWGRTDYGQLGLNNQTSYSSPKQVGALTNWASSSINYSGTSAAVKTDGTLWTWGYNGTGALGIGNTTNYSSPKQVGALTTWSQALVGYTSSVLAIKTDGTLWSWGSNGYGQLGLGNTTQYSSPKQVGALSSWSAVSTLAYSPMGLA